MTLLEADPREIKKTYGATFYWTLKFLNKKSVANISMLYAFYRYTRDIVSIPNKQSSREMLGKLEEELDAPSHTFMARLTQILRQLNLKTLYAKEILSAARFDISEKKIQTHGQLMIYCYKNSGAFGLMIAPALGAANPNSLPFALDLGIASNLTRICRNILQDAKAGEVYLPQEDLERLNLRPGDLAKSGDTPQGLKMLLEKYLKLADNYYESSLFGIAYLPLRSRFGVLLAVRLYQAVGQKISGGGFEVLAKRVHLSCFEKVAVALKTTLETLRPRFWISGQHRQFLHSTFLGLPGVAIAKGVEAE